MIVLVLLSLWLDVVLRDRCWHGLGDIWILIRLILILLIALILLILKALHERIILTLLIGLKKRIHRFHWILIYSILRLIQRVTHIARIKSKWFKLELYRLHTRYRLLCLPKGLLLWFDILLLFNQWLLNYLLNFFLYHGWNNLFNFLFLFFHLLFWVFFFLRLFDWLGFDLGRWWFQRCFFDLFWRLFEKLVSCFD